MERREGRTDGDKNSRSLGTPGPLMCVRVCSLELNKRLSDARPTLLAAHRTACEFTVQNCGTRSGVLADS